ncbi:E2 [Tursiops truncatus papillomavirus 7]|uniref:Regulatory protein E2 n=1 Tax=Tursiops truncatus papillomavirus 7 TaxID=1144383 RepID=H6UYQ5_9PAPI|nr:E2 [Tursiops truncatus papillomavirus 7]
MKESKDKMEALCSRLNALQETQMDLIENDDGDLNHVLKYFECLRKEAMLLCAANQRGHKRVGFTMVPPKQACEASAKQCILMHLAVSSLLSSPFAGEQWLLSHVSHELYMTPPENTLKKQGQTVTVIFDGDKDNCMEYICWLRIYCQMSNGHWGCFRGIVCHEGIYFDIEGERRFYVDFKGEANKFGKGDKWTVMFGGKAITDCALVSSTSTSTCSLGYPTVSTTTGQPSGQRKTQRKRLGPPPSPPPSPPPAPPAPPRPPSPPVPPPRPERDKETCPAGATKRKATAGSGDSCRGTSDCDSDCGAAKRFRTEPGIPCILISGGANQVKCLRHKLKVQHHGLYHKCSTTWSWVGDDTPHPNHRICVSFKNTFDRDVFLKLVPLPVSVHVGLAILPF